MFVEALEDRRLFASGAAKFVAQMLGANEVPARTTPARGVIKFNLSRDGSVLRYKLTAKRIQNVVGAHIHVAPPGQNGTIAVDLVEGMKVRRRNVSMKGTIVAAELTGPLAGMTLADLVAQMTAGTTYINVHTDDGVGDSDTGPGDFPGGEIRGQIRRLGKRFNTAAPVPNPSPAPTPPSGGGVPGY